MKMYQEDQEPVKANLSLKILRDLNNYVTNKSMSFILDFHHFFRISL